jgi:putative membrane protein
VSTRAFFDEAAKTAVRAAIERVESQTCAEIVVTVRREAGTSYRETDFGFGALVALVSLAFVLFVDKEFAIAWIPFDVAVAFAAGALLCRYTLTLRRWLTPGQRRSIEARRAAAEAFQDMGIGRTTGRTGVLVLVALFERRVAVIPDVGVDPVLLRTPIEALQGAVERMNPDFSAFVTALEALGPALASTLPRSADDVNELPDDLGVL